ncbi:MAG: hypothetical protein LC775_08945, partial [Acidobacteria bacterium]|nr:hypothetical protein [Acidobacteriota bacterium]
GGAPPPLLEPSRFGNAAGQRAATRPWGDQSGPLAVQSVLPSPRWLDGRLEAGDRERMAEQYMAGATAAALAERYGISLKSVKRTLQERGARKRA